jgi:5,10-methenyltetrahydromethanopterin hydrogenase
MQDGILTRDTDVLVEFYDDTTDEYGEGIIQSWHSDVYISEETVERAYVLAEDGKSSAYILEENLLPICEVNSYENNAIGASLPEMPDTFTSEGDVISVPHDTDMLELWAATLYSEVAS